MSIHSKREYSDHEIVRLFTILDEDRNSFLDENEIVQWAADIGLSWSNEEASAIIKTADFDTNKTLSVLGE